MTARSGRRENRAEARLSKSADSFKFRRIARTICSQLAGEVVEQVDGVDARYWDIEVQGEVLTLHLQHYLGISIWARDPGGDEIIPRVIEALGFGEMVDAALPSRA